MRILVILAMCSIAMLAPSQTSRSTAQAPANRCFSVPGITDCITGQEFDAYWTGNGGLPVFGYPVTAERPERNRDLDELFMTQWFERNRFEAHPENSPPYHVLLGRLGAELLAKQGRRFEPLPAGSTPSGRCRVFNVGNDRQAVCDPFLRYWETHGLEFDGKPGTSFEESLALFGLPLTSPRTETNPNRDTVRTQWFERARFEDHGAKGVLLGLLGRETLAGQPSAPTGVAPIIDGDTGFLLGGARGTSWVIDEDAVRSLRGGQSLTLYTPDSQGGRTTAGRSRLAGPPCMDTIVVALSPEPAVKDTIVVGGSWNARPRAATVLSPQSEVYRAAVSDILRSKGIGRPDVRLTEVLRVDLEGDGTDEVLISATRMAAGVTPGASAGDYSLVVLRKLVNGQVGNIMLEGEFFPAAREFVAPNEFTIANLLDLNGDGRLEVILDSAYYEGLGTIVYEVLAREARPVLATGCGA